MFARRSITTLMKLVLAAASLACLPGCTWISYLGTDSTGSEFGKTYYIGGAGPFGHVGTLDVPNGLRQAGYRGAIETFGWQGIVPSTIRDQMDRSRNKGQARRLARRIQQYLRRYPDRRVDIIALSAGTGVATWALEDLPPNVQVGTVVFLGSSLSRDHDLRPALRHVRGVLYNFHSAEDTILLHALPLMGSVDRQTYDVNVAGLFGFMPPGGGRKTLAEYYDQHVRNLPYRRQYAKYGYRGGHVDSTAEAFIKNIVAPLIMEPLPAAD